jgi:hypothetical protein
MSVRVAERGGGEESVCVVAHHRGGYWLNVNRSLERDRCHLKRDSFTDCEQTHEGESVYSVGMSSLGVWEYTHTHVYIHSSPCFPSSSSKRERMCRHQMRFTLLFLNFIVSAFFRKLYFNLTGLKLSKNMSELDKVSIVMCLLLLLLCSDEEGGRTRESLNSSRIIFDLKKLVWITTHSLSTHNPQQRIVRWLSR